MRALVPALRLCDKIGPADWGRPNGVRRAMGGDADAAQTAMGVGDAARLIGRAVRPLVDYALPPRCPGCGTVQGDSLAFCLACWDELVAITPPWCALCHRPLGESGVPAAWDARCAPCLAAPPRHDGLHAPFAYGELTRTVAMRFKYGGRIGLAAVMAQAMLRVLPDARDGALLVPVPLHWTRLWSRGFNQAGLLARALSRRTGVAHDPLLLRRSRRTPPLRDMTPAQRVRTVRGAFAIDPARRGRVDGADIWLVDDIHTSGATSDACVRLLKQHGAATVRLLAFARVLREGETAAEPR